MRRSTMTVSAFDGHGHVTLACMRAGRVCLTGRRVSHVILALCMRRRCRLSRIQVEILCLRTAYKQGRARVCVCADCGAFEWHIAHIILHFAHTHSHYFGQCRMEFSCTFAHAETIRRKARARGTWHSALTGRCAATSDVRKSIRCIIQHLALAADTLRVSRLCGISIGHRQRS